MWLLLTLGITQQDQIHLIYTDDILMFHTLSPLSPIESASTLGNSYLNRAYAVLSSIQFRKGITGCGNMKKNKPRIGANRKSEICSPLRVFDPRLNPPIGRGESDLLFLT
ncbi:hypothetical protein ASJ83_06925 [Methanocorpusculum parvum]|uniref:Uncharacterized protein n=1 Tax=Methanocorpusculum parvum TaxID=2193 RepID=A0AAX0Q9Q7_9EURY|nr:hypothetical protein ASJ83_06925 [Methanocorpusculum parvum]